MIPDDFLFCNKFNVNIFHEEDTNDFILIKTYLINDNTIIVHNQSYQSFNKIRFCDHP